jgi:hypothetical protein
MIAALVLLAVWLLYVFYAAVMAFKRARDAGQMAWPMKVFGYPALFVGLLLDAAVNVTVCTVLFLELPREWLVTARLSRHILGDGWRAVVAVWICENLLDELDPSGCHCK